MRTASQRQRQRGFTIKAEIGLEDFIAATNVDEKVRELSFENAMKLLEELVALVESGALPLDQAVSSYERGAKLVDHLRGQLAGAEEKLRLVQRGGS